MSAKATFVGKAPGIMRRLMVDFPLTDMDAAAIVGNLGHECKGFTDMQEDKPVVKGSRGGYGWPQWTGPRRRAYEAYCKRNGLNPASDKANYAYLFVELTGSEKKAIQAVRGAKTLAKKVEAFELAFLRAGIKHYPSRMKYAEWALEAYRGAPVPAPQPKPSQPSAPVSGGWLAAIINFLVNLIRGGGK